MTLQSLEKELYKLTKIGIALTSVHDLYELLNLIVKEARELTNADAGSLYIVEGNQLRFEVSQNQTLLDRMGREEFEKLFAPYTIPITKKSLSGYVAETGKILNIQDVYHLPPDAPYKLLKDFDIANKYRTRSMLIIPMRDNQDKVIAVLQLINSKDDSNNIQPFDKNDEPIISSVSSQAAVAIKNAKLTQEIKQAHYDTIFRLSVAAEYKDQDTASHIKRVSNTSAILAEEIEMSKEEIELVRYASPMHDVGKLGIPDAILGKKGKLTPEEREIMETHTNIGARIMTNSDSEILQVSEIIAVTHHEKFDGTGYPNQIKGEDIPLWGRVVALADVFDAITSKRCYKPAIPYEKAIEIIKDNSGTHFDPSIVQALLDRLDDILQFVQNHQDIE